MITKKYIQCSHNPNDMLGQNHYSTVSVMQAKRDQKYPGFESLGLESGHTYDNATDVEKNGSNDHYSEPTISGLPTLGST